MTQTTDTDATTADAILAAGGSQDDEPKLWTKADLEDLIFELIDKPSARVGAQGRKRRRIAEQHAAHQALARHHEAEIRRAEATAILRRLAWEQAHPGLTYMESFHGREAAGILAKQSNCTTDADASANAVS